MRTPLRLLLIIITTGAMSVAALTGCSPSASSRSLVNVAIQSDNMTRSFNPFLTTSALGQTSSSSGSGGFIYEPLVQINDVEIGHDLPWLASSWAWSNQNKTLTLQLHKNVRWSDGKPFTSKDVAFTFGLLKKYPALNTQGVSFSTVSAPSTSTVVLDFPAPSAQYFTQIVSTPIVSEHEWASVGNPATFADAHPVGTGPFVLSTFSPQSITVTRNAHYWGGRPKIDGLRFIAYKDSQSETNAFVQGDVDWGGTYIADAQKSFVSKSPDNHYWAPVAGQDGLIPNLTVWPLSDLAVRKAISLGVERAQIAAASQDKPALNTSGLPVPAFSSDIASDLVDANFTQDKAGAIAILQKAGYTRGSDGYFQKNGKRLEFSITFPSAYTEIVARIQVLVSQLKDLGIKLDLDATSVNSINQTTGSGHFQSTMGYPVSPAPTAFAMYDAMMNPNHYVPVGQDDSTFEDLERFQDPAAGALFTAYPAATPAKQKQILDQIEHIWADQLPMISLIYWANYSEWSTRHFTGFATAKDSYFAPYPSEVVALHLTPKR